MLRFLSHHQSNYGGSNGCRAHAICQFAYWMVSQTTNIDCKNAHRLPQIDNTLDCVWQIVLMAPRQPRSNAKILD